MVIFSTGTDVIKNIDFAEKQLGNTRYYKDQFNYRNLAYWYAAAGRLNDSYQAYKKAAKLNKKNPVNSYSQSEFNSYIETLVQIIGR